LNHKTATAASATHYDTPEKEILYLIPVNLRAKEGVTGKQGKQSVFEHVFMDFPIK
tara:strand:- start:484 stop:651 length:168 start_codon:yes stop_codon:yes gene_type:complete